jgi:pSer/pThr/pTyr-binding forkhead associated (FHA) protein
MIETPSEEAGDASNIQESNTSNTEAMLSTSDSTVSLNLLNAGRIISIGEQNDATLGRISQGQPVIPDIDLTPFKAYEAGVSRMHASIKVKGELITVTDLGSANGTRINGKKITSHIPYSIKGGDILTLGQFKIQIVLNKKLNGG